jgi:Kinesin motor domain
VCSADAGVTPRVVSELFRLLQERSSQYTYSVSVSMFELYRDGLRDLQVSPGSFNVQSLEHVHFANVCVVCAMCVVCWLLV